MKLLLSFQAVCLAILFACCGKGGAAASKPTPGQACATDGARACLSPDQQAVCQGGQWRAFPCAGPNACATDAAGQVTCDLSGDKDGDACAQADDGRTACDGKEHVACKGGRIQRLSCLGPKGCALDGDGARCDQSISQVGAGCTTPGTASCTADQKTYLECKNGQWVDRATCHGPKGCYQHTDAKLYCDQAFAYVGEACFAEDSVACTADKRGELQCRNGVWAFWRRCSGSRGCFIDDKGLEWCR